MRREVHSYNHCSSFPIDTRLLTNHIRKILDCFLPDRPVELSINLVPAATIAEINEAFLRHSGSTDVITFDYSDRPKSHDAPVKRAIEGEIFVCLDEAIAQAPRFKTSGAQELMRYVIHGILHLLGYQDHEIKARRQMKREENRWLQSLGTKLDRLVYPPRKNKRSRRHG